MSLDTTSLKAKGRDPKAPPIDGYCVCVSTQGAGFCANVCDYDSTLYGLCGSNPNGTQCGSCLPV
ncbi:MAG: hypothetical protein NZ551_02505 [Microscillaceae bacterium]|nr:hypothetical protein [Microscillaceae bacterium]MDW8460057.1 hypothetical protein [Cytophagales bacterium]